jgi:hypothetical protein
MIGVIPDIQTQTKPNLSPAHQNANTAANHLTQWLRRHHPAGLWSSDDLAYLGSEIMERVGGRVPADRTLLAALKRSGEIKYRPNVRVYDSNKLFVQKMTLWSLTDIPGSVTTDGLTRYELAFKDVKHEWEQDSGASTGLSANVNAGS